MITVFMKVLYIMIFFQKMWQLMKCTIYKLCVVCVKPFDIRNQIYGQAIHGFRTTTTHLIMQPFLMSFLPRIQQTLLHNHRSLQKCHHVTFLSSWLKNPATSRTRFDSVESIKWKLKEVLRSGKIWFTLLLFITTFF